MGGLLFGPDTLTDEQRAMRGGVMMAIGQGLSQLGAGQPVNMSPAFEALQARQSAAQMRKVLEVPGIMDRFTPQQQAVLASMPEELATKIIMEQAFAAPPDPTKGIEVDGQLINPITGEVMYAGQPDATGRIVTGQAAAELGLPPDGAYNVTEGPDGISATRIADGGGDAEPITRMMKLADGSDALVQWDDATETWQPAKVPEGGTTGQPRAKLTESQARITLFQSMQSETAPILDQIEEVWNPANLPDAAARAVPIAGNFFQSGQGQMYSAAASAWAEGALRISTGAAATQPEIERVKATYFAVPGDTPATIEFKRDLRTMYERAIRRSLGETGVTGSLFLPQDFADIVAPPEMSREDALKVLGSE